MKRLVLLLVCISATPAFASRARVLVMGTGDPFGVIQHGSLYYDEAYNMFYNPSMAANFGDWIAIEKTNGSFAERAEGGLVTSFGSFNVGAFFNRGDAITAPYANSLFFRPVDLIVAADLGFKAGISATFGGYTAGTAESRDLTLRAGAQVSEFEPFISAKVKGSGTTGSVDLKSGAFGIGTRYRWGEFTPFALFQNNSTTLGSAPRTRRTAWTLGISRNTKVGDGVHLNIATAYWRETSTSHTIVPIDLSLEGNMTTWLVARAGLTFRIIDRLGGNSQGDVSSARVGAAIILSKLNFDWAIGHSPNTVLLDGPAFDFAHGFFSAASLTYKY